jgi:serine acetyltransferase
MERNSADDSEWQTQTGLTREEFEKFTRYCNCSENSIDSMNRARILGLKTEGVQVATGAVVRLSSTGSVGKGSFLGLYCYINGHVTIGEHVLIGPHCSITSNNHVFDAGRQWFGGNKGGPIVIGDGVWLASGCMVTAGVTIGKCALICANAVLTKDVPPYAIMAGTPARQVGHIDPSSGEYHWYSRAPSPASTPEPGT